MRLDMWPTMWKPNKFCHSVNIKWHSFKFEDQYPYIGANLVSDTDLLQKSTEVIESAFGGLHYFNVIRVNT